MSALDELFRNETIQQLEELRIKIDSLIKKIDYKDQNEVFNYLVDAKDKMGLAQLKLKS